MWRLGSGRHSQLHNDRGTNVSKRVDFDVTLVRILLDLADDPRQVATDSGLGRLSVVVPDDLWQRYETYRDLAEKKKGK